MVNALTHPSYAQESNLITNNQRLEFLGDAVLNFVVAEYLYTHYPQLAEGELTKIRARVVCEPALCKVANQLNLGQYLLLGKGEEKSGDAIASRSWLMPWKPLSAQCTWIRVMKQCASLS